jgi:hypothetical protein
LIGREVLVWWQEDHCPYYGLVDEFDSASYCHRVFYNDGEWEFINLQVEPFFMGRKVEDAILKNKADMDKISFNKEDEENGQQQPLSHTGIQNTSTINTDISSVSTPRWSIKIQS